MSKKLVRWRCSCGHRMNISNKQIKDERIRFCYCGKKPSQEEWVTIVAIFGAKYLL